MKNALAFAVVVGVVLASGPAPCQAPASTKAEPVVGRRIELIPWYLVKNERTERTRLLARAALPASNGNGYYELVMPAQGTSAFVDHEAPLVGANEVHFVVLYPEAAVKGYSSVTWLGTLPPRTAIRNAHLRIWCVTAGQGQGTVAQGKSSVSVTLKQYSGDPTPSGKPNWEGGAQFDVTTATWQVQEVDLKPQGSSAERMGEVQVVAFTVTVESGEPVVVSTSPLPAGAPNPAMPMAEILEKARSLGVFAVLRHRGQAIAPVPDRVLTNVRITLRDTGASASTPDRPIPRVR
jgi:hypothetical protein